MKPTDQDSSGADGLNAVAASPQKPTAPRSVTKGDVPPGLPDRYLIERDRQGRPERFYRDHRATDPMIRDEGRKLVAGQTYPDTISDMMKIARHGGWTQVRVFGDEAFRREAWVQAQTQGLKVKGYKPRDRDRQAAGDRTPPQPRSGPVSVTPTVERVEKRLKEAAVVVRRLIADPSAQARLLERAYGGVRDRNPSRADERHGVKNQESDRHRR